MKFGEISYERPDLQQVAAAASAIFDRFAAAGTFEGQWKALLEYQALRKPVSSAAEVATVRHSVDTTDPFYAAEQDFFDEQRPRLQELNDRLYGLLLDSPFRADFEARLGRHLFNRIALEKRVFSPAIMDDLALENRLVTAYDKLLGGAQIPFRGETYTLAGLGPFTEDPDRATRQAAQEASWGFFADNAAELDRLYDELVTVRDRMARTLGYPNFVPMGYDRMGRTAFGPAEVERFRAGVLEHVVPLAVASADEQRARLGLDRLTFYDVPVKFASGNPRPQGGEEWLTERARAMYDELSPQTSAFFRLLLESEHLDLSQKPGKQPGGYCTFIEGVGLPFIFSNFNGTSGDVDVLTHEAGHAFQGWLQRDVELSAISDYTSEVAEIHSMSMEFFTHPWMEGFFGPDTEKYYYSHVVDALKFLPYGASIDEFQEWVYENVDATPDQRRAKYRELERKYLPHLDYDGMEFLEKGGRWQKQLHVYLYPFYYLDYTLSQVCALQYFTWDRKDHGKAWESYLTLCHESGRLPFKQLVPKSGLKSPFVNGTIASVTPELEKYLDGLDRSKIK